MADTATIEVNVFDGTRRLISSDVELLIRVIDGNQNQVRIFDANGSSVKFEDLTYYDNLRDNYTVIAYAKHYAQVGFIPFASRRKWSRSLI